MLEEILKKIDELDNCKDINNNTLILKANVIDIVKKYKNNLLGLRKDFSGVVWIRHGTVISYVDDLGYYKPLEIQKEKELILEPLNFDKYWEYGTSKKTTQREFIDPILNHISEMDHILIKLIDITTGGNK